MEIVLHPYKHTSSSAQFRSSNRGPGPAPSLPVSPPPPREKRENNFYWSPLPGDRQTSGAVFGPGHVSRGSLRRGRGGQIAGSLDSTPPFPPAVASSQPHPTQEKPGPAATPSDPQAPPRRRARCHVTTLPLKHRRNAGRQKAFTPARLGPAPPGAGESRSPGGEGGAEGGLGGGPERATKASALVAVVPERAGAPFSGPAGWVRSHESSGVPAAPTAVAPPRAPGRSATATPRTGPRGLPPPRAARAGPARPPAPRSRSLALARPPFWIGVSSPRAAAAAFPLFPAPRRCRRRPYSPQLPIRAPPAVDLVSPQKSPVCYSRCGGVVTGWSPGVRERGPRLQRSCNPNPPSGGIFHTPMAPLQTWVRTALCWPRRILPR